MEREVIKKILREFEDDFEWIRGSGDGPIFLESNIVYCFNPPLNDSELIGFSERVQNSESLNLWVHGITNPFSQYNLYKNGVKYIILDDKMNLYSWCNVTTCEEIELPVVNARELFKI
jgi:hypothetical protein